MDSNRLLKNFVKKNSQYLIFINCILILQPQSITKIKKFGNHSQDHWGSQCQDNHDKQLRF